MFAGRKGPSLYFNADNTTTNKVLSLVDTIMEHNVASTGCVSNCSSYEVSYGGAVYAGLGLTSLTMKGLTMVNNSADFGGSVYVNGHYNVSITDCDFHLNSGMSLASTLAALTLVTVSGTNQKVMSLF